MRSKNVNPKSKFNIYAVTGTNTVAFGIDCSTECMKGLLGFTVEKEYMNDEIKQQVRITVMGFKVFEERIESPIPGALYSTYDNPIQSFVWEDYSLYPGKKYTYHFTPLYGHPLNIQRDTSIPINIETEKSSADEIHNIYFNRGVASSQAYARKFGNKNPDEFDDDRAYKWLSRGLNEALIDFINSAKPDDELYGCFYEFRNDQILTCFKEAVDRGVKLNLIYDAKNNEHIDDETNQLVKSFPKVENEEAIKKAKLDDQKVNIHPRERNKTYISHNKFIVLLSKNDGSKVWTGSTNISKGGIFGQANVGHTIKDNEVAKKYLDYWKKLKEDPTSSSLKTTNEELQQDLNSLDLLEKGMHCIFSPRKDLDMLKFYAELLDSAKDCACITLAFGIHKFFELALSDNTSKNALTFLLLERDEKGLFDYVYKNNVVKAVGSYIQDDSTYKWVKETNTKYLGLNTWVKFIHTKFLLVDPLSNDPIVVTGSANFSEASLEKNDENMLIIKGDKRVADIYFTEFLRLFNHYYFRWVVNQTKNKSNSTNENPAFLKSDDSWTEQYKNDKYKRKKIEMFTNNKEYFN